MNDSERELWTEQILHWMCSTDTGPEIRFACGQALAGLAMLHSSASTSCFELRKQPAGHNSSHLAKVHIMT